MKVCKLIDFLKEFDQDSEVLVRESHGGGYYVDRHFTVHELYPSSQARIIVGHQAEDQSESGERVVTKYD